MNDRHAVTRDDNPPNAVAHDGMHSFTDDLKACLFQGANGRLIIDAWQLGHGRSNGDDLARDFSSKARGPFGTGLKVFLSRL